MASKTKTSTVAQPSSVEFEPYCEWKKEENADTLVLHLPDFKKDQLRVQVNNLGLLKVSGEKLEAEGKTTTKKFLKETKVPQGCDINDIRAKFSGGYLHVIMPKAKKVEPQVQVQPQQAQKTTPPSGGVQPKEYLKPKPSSTENGKSGTISNTSHDPPKEDNMFGVGSSLGRFQVQKKVSVSLGFAVAVIVAIGAYAAYRYGSSSAAAPPHAED